MAVDKATTDTPCPDPSMHDKHNKLSEQASTAALYVTNPNTKSGRPAVAKEDVLDKDGKLSSKGAAASLKYAKPQDLPSFPSVGISTSSAGAAAVLAKDYKGKEMWKPDGTSSAGSRAALLAHRDGGKLDLWQPTASKDGNSAATLAMRNKGLSPQLDRGYTAQGKSNALLAATKSQKDTRDRAGMTPSPGPELYPDQSNSAKNALNAATVVHRSSVRAPQSPAKVEEPEYSDAAMRAARVHNIGKNVAPEMWGERPPVEIELEEQRQKAALRASAVSMAKQMYEYQNRTVLESDPSGEAGASAAQKRAPSSQSQPDLKQEALRYIHLQDAAQKLAQERLAKVDKGLEHMKYREHYGYDAEPHRSRLSMRGRPRQRASSEQPQNNDDDSSDDEERARRVRRQMSHFNTAVADVDAKKKEADRKALLAAAQRNVHQSMDNMDERVFQTTGKVSQAKMDEWAAKARKKAEEEAKARGQNQGKLHVGGGKFMDQAEIEAIAQSRLQPTLDQINDTAEKKRARDEELRLDREEQERQKRSEKEKQKAEKEEAKQAKQEEKAVAKKEKDERKAAENERKAAEKEEKARKNAEAQEEKRKSMEADGKPERKSFLSRLASKRKSRNVSKEEADGVAAGTAAGAVATGTDGEEGKKSVESTEPNRASADNNEVVGAPLSPVNTGGSKLNKPDLERHITNIETSSESESDNEEDRERKREKKRKGALGFLSGGSKDKEDKDAAVKDDEPVVAKESIEEPAVVAPVVAAPATASTTGTKSVEEPRESTASSRPDVEKEKEKDSKRIRGFFTKLRNRQSSKGERSAEKEATSPTTTTTAAAAPAALPTASDPRPASPSSFTRHRAVSSDDADPDAAAKSSTDLGDVSSLSSSGLEEDDLQEGRTGRMARALGLKKGGKGKEKATDVENEDVSPMKGVKSDEEGSDQFEEARDHFDEGLAPRPSFGGQVKSASPARETKFHEEV